MAEKRERRERVRMRVGEREKARRTETALVDGGSVCEIKNYRMDRNWNRIGTEQHEPWFYVSISIKESLAKQGLAG